MEAEETKKYLDFTGLGQYDAKLKVYIAAAIAEGGKIRYTHINELPGVESAEEGIIYLKPKPQDYRQKRNGDVFEEWMVFTVNGTKQWELLGDTEINTQDYETVKDDVRDLKQEVYGEGSYTGLTDRVDTVEERLDNLSPITNAEIQSLFD